MSTFSRAQANWLTPPDGPDTHPWSEELWSLLENAGVDESTIQRVDEKLSEEIGDMHQEISSVEELLSIAASCAELEKTKAIVWNNKIGEFVCVNGENFVQTVLAAAKVTRNAGGSHYGDDAFFILEKAKVENAVIEKAMSIFDRCEKTFCYVEY